MPPAKKNMTVKPCKTFETNGRHTHTHETNVLYIHTTMNEQDNQLNRDKPKIYIYIYS